MQPGNPGYPYTSSARRIIRFTINKDMQQQSTQVITLLATWHGLGAYISRIYSAIAAEYRTAW
jgi:hypothetical protein